MILHITTIETSQYTNFQTESVRQKNREGKNGTNIRKCGECGGDAMIYICSLFLPFPLTWWEGKEKNRDAWGYGSTLGGSVGQIIAALRPRMLWPVSRGPAGRISGLCLFDTRRENQYTGLYKGSWKRSSCRSSKSITIYNWQDLWYLFDARR